MNILSTSTMNFGKIHIANQTVQRKILKGFSEDYGSDIATNYENNYNKANKSQDYDIIVNRYADVYIKNNNTGLRTPIKGFSTPFRNLSNALRTVILLDEFNK